MESVSDCNSPAASLVRIDLVVSLGDRKADVKVMLNLPYCHVNSTSVFTGVQGVYI